MSETKLTTSEINRVLKQAAGKLASPNSGGFSIEDLTQEAWVRMLASKQGIPNNPKLLYTIAYRRMIDAIRSDSVKRYLSLDFKVDEKTSVLDLIQAEPVQVPETDDRMVAMLALQDDFGCTLKGRDRDLWYGHMVADEDLGETLEDIGARWGVSRQRLAQVAKVLRTQVKEYVRTAQFWAPLKAANS